MLCLHLVPWNLQMAVKPCLEHLRSRGATVSLLKIPSSTSQLSDFKLYKASHTELLLHKTAHKTGPVLLKQDIQICCPVFFAGNEQMVPTWIPGFRSYSIWSLCGVQRERHLNYSARAARAAVFCRSKRVLSNSKIGGGWQDLTKKGFASCRISKFDQICLFYYSLSPCFPGTLWFYWHLPVSDKPEYWPSRQKGRSKESVSKWFSLFESFEGIWKLFTCMVAISVGKSMIHWIWEFPLNHHPNTFLILQRSWGHLQKHWESSASSLILPGPSNTLPFMHPLAIYMWLFKPIGFFTLQHAIPVSVFFGIPESIFCSMIYCSGWCLVLNPWQK